MNEWLSSAFSLVCGQHPGHIWMPGGIELPFCQRCTGLYVGAACAVALHLLCRLAFTGRFRWLHALFLLQMIPFGFHWLPQGPALRTVTGALFAFGLVAYLLPGPCEELRARRLARSRGAAEYWAGLAVVLAALLATARWGGVAGGVLLEWAGLLGALSLAALVLLNLFLLSGQACSAFRRRIRRHPPTAAALAAPPRP